jgi:cytochrome b pre-mRNA-processing protein 3
MIFGLIRRREGNGAVVERLYGRIADTAREPVPYRDLGVPDTFEGRFEMLTLCATLVLRRLAELPEPAAELARDLADTIFREFDRALRESGVGDLGVPKKMKTLASAFYGRAHAYQEALAEPAPALEEALSRNVLAGAAEHRPGAAALARWTREAAAALEATRFEDIVAARLPFPAYPSR